MHQKLFLNENADPRPILEQNAIVGPLLVALVSRPMKEIEALLPRGQRDIEEGAAVQLLYGVLCEEAAVQEVVRIVERQIEQALQAEVLELPFRELGRIIDLVVVLLLQRLVHREEPVLVDDLVEADAQLRQHLLLAQLHFAVYDHLVVDVGLIVQVDSVGCGHYADGQNGVLDELVNRIRWCLLLVVVIGDYRHLFERVSYQLSFNSSCLSKVE